MLSSLHIENIAVIRCADIDFSNGFCVFFRFFLFVTWFFGVSGMVEGGQRCDAFRKISRQLSGRIVFYWHVLPMPGCWKCCGKQAMRMIAAN